MRFVLLLIYVFTKINNNSVSETVNINGVLCFYMLLISDQQDLLYKERKLTNGDIAYAL